MCKYLPHAACPPSHPHFCPLPIPAGPAGWDNKRPVYQTWVHIEGTHVTMSPRVTHARKPLSLGLNNLHFSSPELASNCMWADLARNGLNDQLEGKKEFLSLKLKGPCWRALLPKPCSHGPAPSSPQCPGILYICLTIMNQVLTL